MEKTIEKNVIEENVTQTMDNLTRNVDQATLKFNSVLAKYQRAIKELEEQIKVKEKAHAQKVNIIYQLKQQISEKQKKRQSLIKDNADGIKEIESLEISINTHKQELISVNKFNEELASDCESLMKVKADLIENFKLLKLSIQNSVEKNSALNGRKELLAKNINNIEAKIDTTTQRLEEINLASHRVDLEIKSKEIKIEQLNNDVIDLNNSITTGLSNKKELEQKRDSLQVEINSLMIDKENLMTEKLSVDERQAFLTNQLSEIKESKKLMIDSNREIKNKIKARQEEIVNLSKEIKKIENDTARITELYKRHLDFNKSERFREENTKSIYKQALKTSEHAKFDLEKVQKEKSLRDARIKELQQMVMNKNVEHRKLESKTKAIQYEIETYKVKTEQIEKTYMSYDADTEKLANEYQKLEIQLNSFKDRYVADQEKLEKMESKHKFLLNKIAVIKAEIEKVNKDYQYSQTYTKNLNHIISKSKDDINQLKMNKDAIDQVVKYLGNEHISAKSLERRLKDHYVFLDVKTNYLICDIPLKIVEKYEVVADELYHYAISIMSDDFSPIATIKNYENNLFATAFTIFFNDELNLDQVFEKIGRKVGHTIKYYVKRSSNKYIIDIHL